jgi:glycosyltransferase involved in cell wall biosynthesis
VTAPTVEVVVPTVGRSSLHAALAPLLGRVPVVVVDDRDAGPELALPDGVRVLRSWGGGPAAARNVGWRATSADWVAFLDDDVLPPADWVEQLTADLAACGPEVGATQGRLRVPLPADRRPTDWERSTAGLETAVWATADMAYRRAALELVGGFDERFPRAYREDADLGLRVTGDGWRIVRGCRSVEHPVRQAPWQQSIRSQRGNADDVLMGALHGSGWRRRASVPPGRRPWHLATTGALLVSLHPRWRRTGLLTWAALTADFARRRIAAGPRTPQEVATMAVTSAVVPLAATAWWLVGWARLPGLLRRAGPFPAAPSKA